MDPVKKAARLAKRTRAAARLAKRNRGGATASFYLGESWQLCACDACVTAQPWRLQYRADRLAAARQTFRRSMLPRGK